MSSAYLTSRTEFEDLSLVQQTTEDCELTDRYLPTTNLRLVKDVINNPLVGFCRVYVDDTLRRQLLCCDSDSLFLFHGRLKKHSGFQKVANCRDDEEEMVMVATKGMRCPRLPRFVVFCGRHGYSRAMRSDITINDTGTLLSLD